MLSGRNVLIEILVKINKPFTMSYLLVRESRGGQGQERKDKVERKPQPGTGRSGSERESASRGPGRAQGRVPPGFLRGSLCPASSPGQARKLNWLGPRGAARRPRRAQPGTARVTEGQRAPQGQVGCQTRARFWGQTGGADCLTSVGLDLLVLKQSNDPSLPRRRCATAGRGPGQRTPRGGRRPRRRPGARPLPRPEAAAQLKPRPGAHFLKAGRGGQAVPLETLCEGPGSGRAPSGGASWAARDSGPCLCGVCTEGVSTGTLCLAGAARDGL